MVLVYDYTVLAGTQGSLNHRKTDRVLQLAEQWRLPLVLFAEGGGGRPGDTDHELNVVAGLHVPTFRRFARLSGAVPRVGVVSRLLLRRQCGPSGLLRPDRRDPQLVDRHGGAGDDRGRWPGRGGA